MKGSKILAMTTVGLTLTVLAACNRGDSSLKAGTVTPAKAGAAGAGGAVEGAVYAPKDVTQKNMAPPQVALANVIIGDASSGFDTPRMSFSCTTGAVQAIQYRKEPVFRIEPGSQIIARQNIHEPSPDPKDSSLGKFVSFNCKPKVEKNEVDPATRTTLRPGKPRTTSMMNRAVEVAVNGDEMNYDEQLSAHFETAAAETPAVTAPGAALPANVKAVVMKSEGRLTLNVYFDKEQPGPLSLKVLCVEREKMATAEKIFEPQDKATPIPDLLFAVGTKAVIQTKLKDATDAQYQVVACETSTAK